MDCSSCQARLPPGASTCYVCGAPVPPGQLLRRAGLTIGWSGHGGSSAAQTHLEGWRIWTSFFLGGLYAPVAAVFLIERDEHVVQLSARRAPPVPPSQRASVVFGLLFGVLAQLTVHLGLLASIPTMRYASDDGGVWEWSVACLAPSAALLVSLAVARHVRRRYRLLVGEVSGQDATVIGAFEQQRGWRALAHAVAALPFLLLVGLIVSQVMAPWRSSFGILATLHFVTSAFAIGATSWLCIEPSNRYRTALMSVW